MAHYHAIHARRCTELQELCAMDIGNKPITLQQSDARLDHGIGCILRTKFHKYPVRNCHGTCDLKSCFGGSGGTCNRVAQGRVRFS
jgi:hypothetical protein